MKFKIEEFIRQRREMVSSGYSRYRFSKGCKCYFRKTITDHLGNVFSSIQRMIEFYKIKPGRYYYFRSRYAYLEPAEILQKILDKQKEEEHGKKAPTHT